MKLTPEEAIEALNTLRSNMIATRNASWSNFIYPFVAILDAAGCELFEPTEDQIANHLFCYGGAGGFPGRELEEPGRESHEPGYSTARLPARHIVDKRDKDN
jgi:hypothetical protein